MDWTLHLRVTKMCPSRAIYVIADGHGQEVQPMVLREKTCVWKKASSGQGVPGMCLYSNLDENYAFSLPVPLNLQFKTSPESSLCPKRLQGSLGKPPS